jgi:hypothetical protein
VSGLSWDELLEVCVDAVTADDMRDFVGDVLGVVLQPKQRQAEELSFGVRELLYGGAAGGGKTYWLVAHAAACMLRWPGARGVIFRRTFPSLRRTVVADAVALLSRPDNRFGRLNKADMEWVFPNGSVLEFGHLQHEDSKLAYQGAQFTFIGFEEVTEFSLSQFEYMRSRLRTASEGAWPHIVATANPGGEGHAWVKARWVAPPADVSGGVEVVPLVPWVPVGGGGELGESARRRVFVPAALSDNPRLLELNPEYGEQLDSLPPRLRAAFRDGDWDALEKVEGALWEQSLLDRSRVEAAPQLKRVVVAVDPALSDAPEADETGVVVVGRGLDDHGYVLADRSCRLPALAGPGEESWPSVAVEAAVEFSASEIVVETNQGAGMVVQALRDEVARWRAAGRLVQPVGVKSVVAGQNKQLRALPYALLWSGERPLVHLVGLLPRLEDQMCTWVPGARRGGSPDRVDALVWGLRALGLRVSPQRSSELVAAEAAAGMTPERRVVRRRERRRAESGRAWFD